MRRCRAITAAMLTSLVAFAACGSSSGSEPSDTSSRTKNNAITTIPGAATTVPAPTTTIGVDDPAASPRPTLPVEAAPDSTAAVPSALATDGVLNVSSASWVAADGPRQLVWTLTYRGRQVTCTNCAFVSQSTKQMIAAVLGDAVGDGVQSVVGFDPSALAGDYRSNGWAAEFVVGTDINSSIAGDGLQRWVLECPGGTCRSQSLKVAEMRWGNRMWSVADCGTPLWRGGPTDIGETSVLEGASASATREAALDRVLLAGPHFRPVIATGQGSGSVNGYVATGCAS